MELEAFRRRGQRWMHKHVWVGQSSHRAHWTHCVWGVCIQGIRERRGLVLG